MIDTIKKIIKKIKGEKKELSGHDAMNEAMAQGAIDSSFCAYCKARPAVITAPNGKRYCQLTCQSNDRS